MKTKKYNTIDQFVAKQRELLKLEQSEEVCQRQQIYENKSIKELVKRGVCVNRLRVDHHRTGLFGKHVIVFNLNTSDLHSHKLSSGDIVGLYPNKGDNGDLIASGLVASSRPPNISVAFNEAFDLLTTSLYRLMKLTNDVTYRRLNSTINNMEKSNKETNPFFAALFPCKTVEDRYINPTVKITQHFNQNLDQSQKDAVYFAVSTSLPLSVIHGPPGTGKTTTVVEIIQQLIQKFHKKILVCAPSNIAVDNLVERLAKLKTKVVRLGHPARIIEDVQRYSLDAIIDSHDSSDVIRELKAEITTKCAAKSKGGSKQKWDEVKVLRKDLAHREQNLMKSILADADVILSTTTSASKEGPLKLLEDDHFDLLIIDEAAQAMEISCWIPMLKVKRCILAGDHLQLPPTIISEKAAREGLEVTLLERVVHGLGQNAVQMLTTQYRMNDLVMRWPSEELYENKLVAADIVANHLLCNLEGVTKTENTSNPLVFVDTAGCNMYELEDQEEDSKGNTWEVDIVYEQIVQLVEDGVNMRQIGVITPYNLQVDMIRKKVQPKYPSIEVNSVDGFQGREKEAILISLVRSNQEGKVGFLKEDRRINVAITRARRHLFVVGDTSTISRHPFLESFSNFMFEKAVVRSPLADQQDINGTPGTTNTNIDTSQFELPPAVNPTVPSQGNSSKTNSNTSTIKKNDFKEPEKTKEKITTELTDETKHSKHSNNVGTVTQQQTPEWTDAELQQKLIDIAESSSSSSHPTKAFEFPSHLTAKQRALVHEKAEELGLSHQSIGEGQQRRIVVDKKKKKETVDVVSSVAQHGELSEATCLTCSARMPKSNLQLHSIRCFTKAATEKTVQENGTTTSGARPKTSSKSNAKKKKSKPNENTKSKGGPADPDEDIDSLLEEFTKMNNSCGFGQCKISIKTLGQKCTFCSKMFCLTHHMAEIHGCGHDIRVRARQDIAKYGSAKPTPMNRTKKVQVQKKLDKKLDELQGDRKRKTKKK